MTLLAALVGSLTLAAITDTAVAAHYRDAADARYAAEAAVELRPPGDRGRGRLVGPSRRGSIGVCRRTAGGHPPGGRRTHRSGSGGRRRDGRGDPAARRRPSAVGASRVRVVQGHGAGWPPTPASTWPYGSPIGLRAERRRRAARDVIRGGGGVWGKGSPPRRRSHRGNGPTPQRFACSRGANCHRCNAIQGLAAQPDKDHARILSMRYVGMRSMVAALILVGAATASAQSLADVARQEEARRKAVAGAGKVYTNDVLQPEPPPSPGSVPAATPAPAAPPRPTAPSPRTPRHPARRQRRKPSGRSGSRMNAMPWRAPRSLPKRSRAGSTSCRRTS